ncbi:MAG: ArsC/Spx/MgsR family protein [Pseudomonadota bacterium]
MTAIVYHNPRCSKSRATLALLDQRGIDYRIVEYLNAPPRPDDLLAWAEAMQTPLRSLLRAHETEQDVSTLSDSALAKLMSAQPTLIQRPLVVLGNQVRVGRPPEAVLELFS